MSKIKVVVNTCFGGFGLSDEAAKWLEDRDGKRAYGFYAKDRSNPLLIECVETLGTEKASGYCASLAVKTINIEVELDNYDGKESVSINHSYENGY